MAGWHHLLNVYEFEQVLGDSEEHEAWLATVHEVTKSHMTEQLNHDQQVRGMNFPVSLHSYQISNVPLS